MQVHDNIKEINHLIQLYMKGIFIERVSEYKYLGVWLSDTLGWTGHVNRVVRRASRQVGMIYRTGTFHQFFNSETLLRLYVTHIRLLLEYASQAWDPLQRTLDSFLEVTQRRSSGQPVTGLCQLRLWK